MKKILLIEDNADILYANRVMLELEGYEVLTAQSVRDGRACALTEAPELIVLDIMLPDGNGIELCRELNKDRSFKVIFLSALGTGESTINAIKAGGYDYVTKPYLMRTLIEKINNLLQT